MTLDPLIIEVMGEVIAPSKDNNPLRSPDILRRETRIGVSKFGLEYVTGQVNSVLQDQIGRISEHRLGSDKFYDRLAKKSTSHEYTDLNPKTLLRIVGSYVRKSQLRDKNDDHSRLSAVEAHELEGLYEFLKTKNGRQLLHKGIIDAMELDFPYLGNIDSDRLKSLDFVYSEGVSKELAKRVRDLAEFTNAVEESWNSVDRYVNHVRNMLIQYYEGEINVLEKSIEALKNIMKRKEYSILYNGGEIPGDNKITFEISRIQKKMRLSELYTERAKDNPTKVTIVVRK